ncbi:hypothetical protein ES705_43728 [subsurface metagenome]
MKIEKIPEKAFVIKFEMTAQEAKKLLIHLNLFSDGFNEEHPIKELHEALRKLLI